MKLIDGDSLLEEAAREKLDTREAVLNMITRQPEVTACRVSKGEAYSISEYIDLSIFDHIRNDTDIDSVMWLINIVDIYKKMCRISGYVGAGENGNEPWRFDE